MAAVRNSVTKSRRRLRGGKDSPWKNTTETETEREEHDGERVEGWTKGRERKEEAVASFIPTLNLASFDITGIFMPVSSRSHYANTVTEGGEGMNSRGVSTLEMDVTSAARLWFLNGQLGLPQLMIYPHCCEESLINF